jgi:tetratricopeptide (TPR) repeat protein
LNPTLESIQEALSRASSAIDAHDLSRAREELLKAQALAEQAGITSPFLTWRLSVVHDLMEDPLTALKYINEAVRMDPLAQPFRHSLGLILKNLRRKLLAEIAKGADTSSVSTLYDALIRAAGADDATHVAVAGYLLDRGDPSGALRIASAVTLLSPACEEAWLVRARICRALGDDAAAREAETCAHAANAEKGVRPLVGLSSGIASA